MKKLAERVNGAKSLNEDGGPATTMRLTLSTSGVLEYKRTQQSNEISPRKKQPDETTPSTSPESTSSVSSASSSPIASASSPDDSPVSLSDTFEEFAAAPAHSTSPSVSPPCDPKQMFFTKLHEVHGDKFEEELSEFSASCSFDEEDEGAHTCSPDSIDAPRTDEREPAALKALPRKLRFAIAPPKENGKRFIVSGSREYPKKMGVYEEVSLTFNKMPVYREIDAQGMSIGYLYYHKGMWRIAAQVGDVACLISACSSERRPHKVRSIWCESRRSGSVQLKSGNSSIAVRLTDSYAATSGHTARRSSRPTLA